MSQPPTRMRQLFSAASHQQLLMNIEVVLARVQARAGIVPEQAATAIAATASVEAVPLSAVDATRQRVGHPMVALLDTWNDVLTDGSGEWLHFGATTQDIEDTALLLEARSACELILGRLRTVEDALLSFAEEHAGTPMIGRTVGRHALPITFCLKVSRWAAENRRGVERIKAWYSRHAMGMLSGAVGTYASLGPDAIALERAFLSELGLQPWAADWKGSRDMFAELGGALSILAMTWRKIAQELFLLQGDDIAEVEEQTNAVGSSTMPHKHNPRHSRQVMVLSRTVVHRNEELLDWMVSLYERDQVSSAPVLADVCIIFDDLLAAADRMLAAVRVNADQMRTNLYRSSGIMAEHAMMLLASALGKQTAHKLVRAAAQHAYKEGVPLAEAIAVTPALEEVAREMELGRKLDPANYLGLAMSSVRATVAEVRALREHDPGLE